jgi:hypothetical protein
MEEPHKVIAELKDLQPRVATHGDIRATPFICCSLRLVRKKLESAADHVFRHGFHTAKLGSTGVQCKMSVALNSNRENFTESAIHPERQSPG